MSTAADRELARQMKGKPLADIHGTPTGENAGAQAMDLRRIFQEHGQFVWLSLQRLGIRPADLDDVAQDVFMVVHRRLDSFDPSTRVTTWLFGICTRIAANYRRRRRWTREIPSSSADDRPATLMLADEALIRREEQRLAERALEKLNVAKRAIFVMFELEGLTCNEIAELMSIPVGTVYSRLHSARRQLEKTLARSPRWRAIK